VQIDFSPENDNTTKDIRPFVHSLAQALNLNFGKEVDYDGESLKYSVKTSVDSTPLTIAVSGVVPSTCHIEETEVELTAEEVEEAKKKALEEIKTVRKVRKIVCD
jgi:hypothetical protein